MKSYVKLMSVGLILSLGACGGMPENQTFYSPHQPVITRSNFTMDVATINGAIPLEDQGRLARWLEMMDLNNGDQIAIDAPQGSQIAASQSVVADLAHHHGITFNDISPVTPGYIASDSIRVVVTHSKANVPGCPDWSSRSETNLRNGLSSNYGCATNSNLTKMISDKNDLVRGKKDPNAGRTDRSDRAIQAWQERAPGVSGELPSASSTDGGGQ